MLAGSFHIEAAPSAEVERALEQQLNAHNARMEAAPYQAKPYALRLSDEDRRMLGGVFGEFFWQWLNITYLWVDESVRGQGHGARLLAEAEAEAVKRGCVGIYLWTQSWQAPGFYEKQGFARFTTLENFPPGSQRIGLVKKLSGQGA